MRIFQLALAPALLATGSCSYHYDVVTTSRGDVLVFEAAKKTGTGCFSDFSVKSAAGKVLWRVTTEEYSPPPCDSKFPIRYGVTPRGMNEAVKPAALVAGLTYRAEGWDGDSYSGTFRFKRGILVENIPERR